MLHTSKAFDDAIKAPQREIYFRLKINDAWYEKDKLHSAQVSYGSSNEEFAIGTAYANSLKAVFSEVITDFSEMDEVYAEVGVKLPDGTIEYVSLGYFVISEQIDVNRNDNNTTIQCLDNMILMEGEYVSELSYPARIIDVAVEIANKSGMEVNQVSFARLSTRTISRIEGSTYRQAIAMIAQFEGGFAIFDREGKLDIRTLNNTNFEIRPAEYRSKGMTKNDLQYRLGGISVDVDDETTLQAGSISGSQINLENSVMNQDLLNSIYSNLENLNFYPFALEWWGNPALEYGDWVTLFDLEGNTFKAPVLKYSLSFGGGLSSSISANVEVTSPGMVAYRSPLEQEIIAIMARISANGKNRVYDDITEPDNPKENDIWFRPNGPDTDILIYKRNEKGELEWTEEVSTKTTRLLREAIAKQQQKIEEAKQTADEAVDRINNEITGKFTSIDDDILAIETISNSAQANAQTALNQSQDALGDASTALTNAQTALNRADTAIGSASNAATLAGNAVSKADNAQALATSLSGQVSGFETTVAGFNQTVNNYEGQVSGFRNDILGLESTVVSYESEVNEFGNTVSTYATEVSTMRNTVSGFESTVATYGTEVSNLAGEVVGYKNQVSTFNNTVTGFNSTVANYTTEVDEFGTQVGLYATEVSTLTNTVSGFQSKVTKVEQDYAGISGTVATHTSQISNLDGQIALKANTTTVNALTGRVSTAETGITTNANAIKLKANQSTVDTLTGRVNSAETSITANATAIGLKANQTTVDTLSGTVNSLGADVGVVAGQISSKVWNTDIQTAIDDIEVGGRNLLVENRMSRGWANSSGGISGGEPYRVSEHIILEDEEYIYQMWNGSNNTSWWTATYYNESGGYVGGYISRYLPVGHTKELITKDKYPSAHSVRITYYYRNGITHKLEKGNKATDWTPAPEDTLARFDHIETEWTQTFDSFGQTVAGIDGRVTSQKQTIDSISSTVSGHGDRISTVEQTADGLQTTVASKASQTQVTQLADGFKVFAGNIDTKNKNLADKWLSQRINDDGTSSNVSWSRATPMTKIPDNTTHLTVEDGSWGGWYNSVFFWYSSRNELDFLGKYDLSTNEDPGENIVTVKIPSDAKYFRYHTTPNMSEETKIEVGTEATGLFYDDSEIRSEISVLENNINLRVTRGELMSQINIEAGRTLIQSNKLYLDAESVVFSGKAFIPSAAIQNLTADKVTTGTLDAADVNIINMNAKSIVTGTLEGIRVEADEGLIGGWNLESGGLYKQTPYGYTTLKPGGDVAIGIASPNYGYTTGAALQIWHDGTLRFGESANQIYHDTSNNLVIEAHNWLYLKPRHTVFLEGRLAPWANNTGTVGTFDYQWERMYSYGYRLANGGGVQAGSGSEDASTSTEIHSPGSLLLKTINRNIYGQGSIYPYYSSNTYYLGSSGYRWQGVYLTRQPNVASDMRDKKLIQDIPQGLIDNLKEIQPKMYRQKDEWHFGYIAQDVERAIYKYVTSMKKWDSMEDMNEYVRSFAMLHKDESKLSLLYGEIAVIKEAEMQERMDQLENKLEELLNAN